MSQIKNTGWDRFQHSWFSSIDFFVYIFLAILFFNIGVSYAKLKIKMSERQGGKTNYNSSSFSSFASSKYGHSKLKTDEPDEEKLSSADENELRDLRLELEENK